MSFSLGCRRHFGDWQQSEGDLQKMMDEMHTFSEGIPDEVI
jgi:hypothetical protein